MSKLANLKKKAADLEQKRLFDRALAVYEEVLQEQEGAEEADIGLFNRVGDLHLRQGNVEAALGRYEQAVDLYVERGFHNNAVALCNKILRQDPSRAEIHFRLGQISCEKGFRSEARRHFQEYTARLIRDGLLERALTTLGNFADQNEQLDDVRQILADILLTHNRVDEAVVQLARLHEHYEAQQRPGEAQTVLNQILALDPTFEVSHTVFSDSDRDDSGSTAGADVPWSQRSYAPPELVLFDPTGPTTTSRSTPSSAGSTAAPTPSLQEDDIVLFDLDPVAPEDGASELPDGLTHGGDFELSDISPTVDAETSESDPLEFEPTSLDFVAPPVEAMEGLDDGADLTLLEVDDTVAPVELAPSWQSEAGGWEMSTESNKDDEHNELDLTLPSDETELVFITDVDPAASSDLIEDSFTLPDLSASDAAQGLDDATAPPGGWELTHEDDSDEETLPTQLSGPSDDVELLDNGELVGTVDPFDAIYQPDARNELEVLYEPDASFDSAALHQPEARAESEVLYQPGASFDSAAMHQPEARAESEVLHQPDAGFDSAALHQPEARAESEVLNEPDAGFDSAALHQPEARAESELLLQPDAGFESAALHQSEARAESDVLHQPDAGVEPESFHQLESDGEWNVLLQPDAPADEEAVYQPDGSYESNALHQLDAADESNVLHELDVLAESGTPDGYDASNYPGVPELLGYSGGLDPFHNEEAGSELEEVNELDATYQFDGGDQTEAETLPDAAEYLAVVDSHGSPEDAGVDSVGASGVDESPGFLESLDAIELSAAIEPSGATPPFVASETSGIIEPSDATPRFVFSEMSGTIEPSGATPPFVASETSGIIEPSGATPPFVVSETSGIIEPSGATPPFVVSETSGIIEPFGATLPFVASETSGIIEPSDATPPFVVSETSGTIEPSDAIQPSAAVEQSGSIQFSDAIELPAGRLEFGSSESVDEADAAGTIWPAASTDWDREAERPKVVEVAQSPQPSTVGWTPATAVPEPAEDAFVNLGDWLREDDEPRSTRMVVEERAPSGDEQADFAEMLRKFKQGVADNVDEDDHASHYDLGIAFREMGLMDEAIAAFQRALRGTAQRVRSFEALGQCFIDKEQYAVATSVLLRSLREPGADDGRLVGVLYLLGRSAEAQNQRTEALGYYQRVFAVDIEFGDVADRIGAVERVPL